MYEYNLNYLNVSGTALTYLNYEYLHITELKVNNCTALNELNCGSTHLTKLDVINNCPNLTWLNCYYTKQFI